MTIENFYRKKNPNLLTTVNIPFEIDSALNILKKHYNNKIYSTRKIPLSAVDGFLFSGRFNSVLGPEGFTIFKKKLKEIIAKINDNDFSSNIINLDKMFEALLDSGLYYCDDFLPNDFKFSQSDPRWLTAYRYIAKNFPEINYSDFRTIVKRFQDTRGYSFYIEKNDSIFLKEIPKKENLFMEISDKKADLLQLNQSELKEICVKLNILPARSLKDTVDRIIDLNPRELSDIIPSKTKTRINLIIQDQELATGDDLVNLDKYLRELAKIIRNDFADYIETKRYIKFLRKEK